MQRLLILVGFLICFDANARSCEEVAKDFLELHNIKYGQCPPEVEARNCTWEGVLDGGVGPSFNVSMEHKGFYSDGGRAKITGSSNWDVKAITLVEDVPETTMLRRNGRNVKNYHFESGPDGCVLKDIAISFTPAEDKLMVKPKPEERAKLTSATCALIDRDPEEIKKIIIDKPSPHKYRQVCAKAWRFFAHPKVRNSKKLELPVEK